MLYKNAFFGDTLSETTPFWKSPSWLPDTNLQISLVLIVRFAFPQFSRARFRFLEGSGPTPWGRAGEGLRP